MGTLEGLRGRGRSRERTEGGSSDEELKRSKVSNTTVQGPRSHVSTVGLRDHADMRWGVAERSRGGFWSSCLLCRHAGRLTLYTGGEGSDFGDAKQDYVSWLSH